MTNENFYSMDVDRKATGENILKFRKAKHLRQLDLALEIGVSEATICRLEKGTTEITAKQVGNLARYFCVTQEEILCLTA